MLTQTDINEINDYGLTLEGIYRQLEKFSLGIPYAEIVTAASVGNGIEVISPANQAKLISLFEDRKDSLDIVKFVPASGAATRMFKFLFEFLESYDPAQETLNKYLKRTQNEALQTFFASLKEFPFVNAVRAKIREQYPQYKQSKKGERYRIFVSCMLEAHGLNFGQMPKGLIPFHKYTKYATTAFEEQLVEAAHYAAARGEAYLHFTFSPEHVDAFKAKYEEVKKRVSKRTKTKFHVSYSFQKRETDTIAVRLDNHPARDEDGKLIFRPSGHGALLENLNEVDGDIIFIKNIDNVAAIEYVEEISEQKKLLAGKLVWLQRKVFAYLEQLRTMTEMTPEFYKEIKSFIWNELNHKQIPDSVEKIFAMLNRPLRVCGVVPNTGAPGGGPFWVKDDMDGVTLQIVETAQIDTQNPRQASIIKEATHFNPVDLVCGVRDYQGNKFDLSLFSNPATGFISEKSAAGQTIKALELPGLWNGSMAYWNTVFVEVPQITFNPVKTVNDLLKRMHRPNA